MSINEIHQNGDRNSSCPSVPFAEELEKSAAQELNIARELSKPLDKAW